MFKRELAYISAQISAVKDIMQELVISVEMIRANVVHIGLKIINGG